jgi:1-deoxyxylulose-5-phosphate synthase
VYATFGSISRPSPNASTTTRDTWTRQMGSTSLDFSQICPRCMSFRESGRSYPPRRRAKWTAGPWSSTRSRPGIKLDATNGYPHGSSDELAGLAVREFANPDDLVIATKAYHRTQRARPPRGFRVRRS